MASTCNLCCIHFIGGGKIIPEIGTISAGGECTGLTPLTDGVSLELEVSFEKIEQIRSCFFFFIRIRAAWDKCYVSVTWQGIKFMHLCM